MVLRWFCILVESISGQTTADNDVRTVSTTDTAGSEGERGSRLSAVSKIHDNPYLHYATRDSWHWGVHQRDDMS